MSQYSSNPFLEAFDQSWDEMGEFLISFGVLVILALVFLAFQTIGLQRRNNQPGLGPWEEPGDASGLWWPDGSLNLGEVIEWQ